MSNLSQRIANLSPEKQALLQQRLMKKGTSVAKKQTIPRRETSEPCPLSFSQQRLWFLNQLEPNTPFNISIGMRLSGILKVEILQQTLNAIVIRHEALRTTFMSVDGNPVQVIGDRSSVELTVIDLSESLGMDREAEVQRILKKEAQRLFNLSSDLMLGATLLRLGEEEHVLLLVMHHVACDGWSIGILLREFEVFYKAFSTGSPLSLPELPIQYADFAHWQRQWLTGDILETQLNYWKQQLAGAPPLLELPTDRSRPSVQTFHGNSEYFQLNRDLMQKLKILSQQSGKTLFMTLLAAFVILLSRYSGQEDIVVGSPIANRNHSEIESVIGFFINTLVLRTRLQGDPTFLDLLERVREMTLGAYEHQDLPFEKLVEELQPERSLSHAPLFQVMFVLQNTPMEKLELPGLSITPFDLEDFTIADDLFLSMEETETGLVGELVYNSDLFDAVAIARMAGHFQTLLEGIVANPTERISRLPLLSVAEKQQLLEWNNTLVDDPLDQCFPQLFEAQVARTPMAVAVVLEDEQLTYFELNARANRWARQLVEWGVGSHTIVALLSDRNIDFLTAMLAVFKAGGAYLPLNPDHPIERMSIVLEQSQVPLVLAASQLSAMAKNAINSLTSIPQLLLIEDLATQECAGENLPRSCQPEDLAYVIYTSGSTGKPKGVMLEHRGMLNHLFAKVKDLELSDSDTVAQTASVSFDISIWQFLVPLLVGGRVEIVSNQVATDPTPLLALVERQGITILEIVPSLLRMILSELEISRTTKPQLSQLRWLVITGETLAPQLCRQWLNYYPTIPMLNAYGPTECSDDVTHYPIYQPPAQEVFNLPIGRPVLNTQLYILDKHLQPVPVGVPGELCVGGVGVGRGYLNNSQLTMQAFVADPFAVKADSRLYKTGDKARYLKDGNIEFLGRIDDQVKIRGFRIELGEIEAVLAQHACVVEAVVIAREDTPANQHLVAYIVSNQHLTISELRSFLKEKLPDYMVPSAFVMLEKIPVTPNGKVDRRALPTPDMELSLSSFVSPRTPTEEILANLWVEVLSLKQVGIHDNFFELGGHSLLATQVISRLRSLFGVDLPIRHLFEYPTVAELSEAIEVAQQARLGLLTDAIAPFPRNQDLPLSFAQARLWFLNQLEGNSATYNIAESLCLTGHLNLAALKMAAQQIIQRHEALRTTFKIVNGSPVQVIAHDTPIPISVVDWQHLSPEMQSAQVRQWATQESQKPFDLSNEPLLRVHLLQLSPQEHVLLVVMHHIVSDGWSMGVFVHELSVLYQALCANKPSSLPPLPIQYADFAHWQKQWLTQEVLQTQLHYWKDALAGAPPLLELPTDRPRPPIQTFAGSTVEFQLNRQLTQKLQTLSQQSGATLFMTLLAAFAILLSRYSGCEDIVVGSPIANRNRSEIESTIGLFVNTLVLRTQLQGNPTFKELLQRVRQMAIDAYAHQDLPFEKLVEELQPQRSLSYAPLFQVMFVLQNTPMETLELPGLSITPLELEDVTAKFDLTLAMEERELGLVGCWEYNTDLFDTATIARMSAHFQILLEGIVANPGQKVSQFPLLNAAERHQLLVGWNDTQMEYPQDKCIHQLFEEQVIQTPDAVAVVFENQQLTYRELNAQANQLAHHLQALGVGPEVLVGICVDRSLEMVVGLLGTLKAGGAYVPLDPAYPQERLSFMLSDSQVPVLLTQQKLIAQLPEHEARVVCLDADWGIICQESEAHPNTVQIRHLFVEAGRGAGEAGEAGEERVNELLVLSPPCLSTPPAPPACLHESTSYLNRIEAHPISTVQASNLAYVIYTSGSTGKPKGVLVTHEGLCNLALAQIRAFDVQSNSRVLQFASFSFDASISEIVMALCAGARLCLGTKDSLLPGTDLMQLLHTQRITHATLPPSALAAMPTVDLPDLQTIIVAGEACSPHLVAQWSSGRRFINAYGPTESTVCATVNLCTDGNQKPPIGRPIANTQIYILDNNLQPVPIGVAGELHIGGVGLARGYLNARELTLQKFISNPFSQQEGARLYKTGDLARYLPNGNVEFLGRIDHQVKLRGFRIELGEIEALLAQHPSVQEAVVMVRVDQPGNQRLVAYVILDQDSSVTTSELRSFLKEKLPDYMMPSAFVMLEKMPRTPNGKVDRRALRAPDIEMRVSSSFVSPRDTLELQLAQIWEEILDVYPIGVRDNFFDLGGHSLLAINLMARIQQQFGKNLSLTTLFQGATIEHLANILRSSTDSPPWSTLIALKSGGCKRPFFCVHPGVGTVLAYVDLARHLDPEQPFYGLESLGLDEERKPYTQVEDMAAHYIKAMQTVQPQGPYFLGGWSFGGLVAFEMAQQLQAQGQQVSFLALLDTVAMAVEELQEQDDTDFLEDVLAGDDSSILGIPSELDRDQTQRLLEVFTSHIQAAHSYSPQPYVGKVNLFLSSEEGVAADSQDSTVGWGKLANKGVEIHKVPGNHYTMMSKPHVQVLAEQLQVCFEELCIG